MDTNVHAGRVRVKKLGQTIVLTTFLVDSFIQFGSVQLRYTVKLKRILHGVTNDLILTPGVLNHKIGTLIEFYFDMLYCDCINRVIVSVFQ